MVVGFNRGHFHDADFDVDELGGVGAGLLEPYEMPKVPSYLQREYSSKLTGEIHKVMKFKNPIYSPIFQPVNIELRVNPAILKSIIRESSLRANIHGNLTISGNLSSPIPFNNNDKFLSNFVIVPAARSIKEFETTINMTIPIEFNIDDLNEILSIYKLYKSKSKH